LKYLLIAGSRSFEDRDLFNRVTEEIIDGDERFTVIVEGGAAGADTMAREYAEAHDMKYEEFKPDWKQYGRAAGPKRNDKMIQFIKERNGTALYFWDEESKGTKQCIDSAKRKDIEISVWSTKRGGFL
jgi:uncharacterized phage-like protein YoqJ